MTEEDLIGRMEPLYRDEIPDKPEEIEVKAEGLRNLCRRYAGMS